MFFFYSINLLYRIIQYHSDSSGRITSFNVFFLWFLCFRLFLFLFLCLHVFFMVSVCAVLFFCKFLFVFGALHLVRFHCCFALVLFSSGVVVKMVCLFLFVELFLSALNVFLT
uniref:(northern house mosquito) hypothetical protein n=1 Tax=Culex pipiens TaxID=7175 RepID=A0A8D8KAY9_CULPI